MGKSAENIAIRVQRVSKVYDLSLRHTDKFRDVLTRGWENLLGKKPESLPGERFQALKNISFELAQGEVLGVIGDNGAGKSTLLKLLGEVTTPTEGSIVLNGRVSSILEIGTGFHPELSGKENIFLSGQLQGMEKAEIEEKFQQIVAFSGIGDFINVPVKRYSSGMFIRLAFSVASHLDADIVLLDEVLSVGDAEFRVKSLEKIKQLAKSGCTVVLVSHDLNSIDSLCTRCLVLENGEMKAFGSPKEITGAYIERTLMDLEGEKEQKGEEDSAKEPVPENTSQADQADPEALTQSYLEQAERLKNARLIPVRQWKLAEEAPGNEIFRVKRAALHDSQGESKSTFRNAESIFIEIDYWKFDAEPSCLALVILYQLTLPAFFCNPMFNAAQDEWQFDATPGRYSLSCEIPGEILNSGIYTLDLFVVGPGVKEILNVPRLLNFKIELEAGYAEKYNYSGGFPGPMFPRFAWKKASVQPLEIPPPPADHA
ncbi:MAG: ATP-binding cassette domain-containing protein [Bacteroidia bacterium]|nr:ATP-binding cassette domain-containing protein [Bacteroidia bacterium]